MITTHNEYFHRFKVPIIQRALERDGPERSALCRVSLAAEPQPSTKESAVERFIHSHRLSRRERDVVLQLAAGKQIKEIARELDLAVPTVKEYLGSVYRKTGMNGRGVLLSKILSQENDA